jgi:hypothetical protein
MQMKLYKHDNYNEYVKAQIEKNKKKIGLVWVKDGELKLLVKRIRKNIPNASFGICHGVRNAWEVQRLRNYLKIDVIGTDIAPSAKNFPNTIQWDFHKIKKDWKNSVDFIYSNSFDHSYDPKMCLDKWMKCIRKNRGICFIHWMSTNAYNYDAADCFAGTLNDYRTLFNTKYKVVEEFGMNKHRRIFAIKHLGG